MYLSEDNLLKIDPIKLLEPGYERVGVMTLIDLLTFRCEILHMYWRGLQRPNHWGFFLIDPPCFHLSTFLMEIDGLCV